MPNLYDITNTLIQGDPLDPQIDDQIAQLAVLKVGDPLPEGWRVLTGNHLTSLISRVVLRCEVEDSNE